jgi:hypothetical protein
MKEDTPYIPRFSFEITEEQQLRASQLLSTHGIRKAIFSVLLDEVLNMIQEHGQMVVGVLLDESVKAREIVPSLSKAERKCKQ